ADHAEPALAQRCAEMRLAYDRCGGARPIGVVELEPERDVKGEADGGPQPQAKEQRWTRGPRGIQQSRAETERVSFSCRSRLAHGHTLPACHHDFTMSEGSPLLVVDGRMAPHPARPADMC